MDGTSTQQQARFVAAAMVVAVVLIVAMVVSTAGRADAATSRRTRRSASTTTTAPKSTTSTTVKPTTTTAPTTSTTQPTTTTAPPQSPTGTSSTWPDATNTGVPAGTVLTPTGGMYITTDGTVVQNMEVTGCIVVRANNVTIKNTRVLQSGPCWGGAIDTEYGPYSNILIQDVEVDGRNQNSGAPLVGSGGYTCIRCNVHNGGQGFHLTNNVTVVDSWVHDLFGTGTTHNDAVLSNGGNNFVVRHNTLSCDVGWPGNPSTGGGCTGAMNLFGDFGPVTNVIADGNLFNGGAYCVYAGTQSDKPYPVASNVQFTNNLFGTVATPTCGKYGPYVDYQPGNGNVWSGNTYTDGTPIGAYASSTP